MKKNDELKRNNEFILKKREDWIEVKTDIYNNENGSSASKFWAENFTLLLLLLMFQIQQVVKHILN